MVFQEGVKVGDILALLAEYYHSQRQFDKAYAVVGQMKQRRLNITYYVDTKKLTEIYKGAGQPIDFAREEDSKDEIKEDIRVRK